MESFLVPTPNPIGVSAVEFLHREPHPVRPLQRLDSHRGIRLGCRLLFLRNSYLSEPPVLPLPFSWRAWLQTRPKKPLPGDPMAPAQGGALPGSFTARGWKGLLIPLHGRV